MMTIPVLLIFLAPKYASARQRGVPSKDIIERLLAQPRNDVLLGADVDFLASKLDMELSLMVLFVVVCGYPHTITSLLIILSPKDLDRSKDRISEE